MNKLAETFIRTIYNRSNSVDDPQNANVHWRAGYAVGLTAQESGDALHEGWCERGRPDYKNKNWQEWKIGFWSARFTKLCESKPFKSIFKKSK
jgi:hypothetical protein